MTVNFVGTMHNDTFEKKRTRKRLTRSVDGVYLAGEICFQRGWGYVECFLLVEFVGFSHERLGNPRWWWFPHNTDEYTMLYLYTLHYTP